MVRKATNDRSTDVTTLYTSTHLQLAAALSKCTWFQAMKLSGSADSFVQYVLSGKGLRTEEFAEVRLSQ